MKIFPENISSYGALTDELWMLVTVITLTAFVITEAVIIYSVVRFRRRRNPKASYIPGSKWKHLKWVFIPVFIITVLDFYIDAKTHHVWDVIKMRTPEPDQLIRITGQQYSWQFSYAGADKLLDTEDDLQLLGELHVPINQNIVFDLVARDVLHSFWVPELRLKQDALPGRTIRGWFKCIKEGVYSIACAELCGPGHAQMAATLYVHSEEDYKAWLAGTKVAPDALAGLTQMSGYKIMQAKACIACHTIDGSKLLAPTFKGLFGGTDIVVSADGVERKVTIDEAYIRKSIKEPTADIVKGYQPIMPPLVITDDEITEIVEFLKVLK